MFRFFKFFRRTRVNPYAQVLPPTPGVTYTHGRDTVYVALTAEEASTVWMQATAHGFLGIATAVVPALAQGGKVEVTGTQRSLMKRLLVEAESFGGPQEFAYRMEG